MIIVFLNCFAYNKTPTVVFETVFLNSQSSENNLRCGIRTARDTSSSYNIASSYNAPACYANYNSSHYASLSSVDFQQIFQYISDTSEILKQYPLYAFPQFLSFVRTLSCYDTYMLALHDKIQHDKMFRKQTACMPYFAYSFGLRREKSGFHDFVNAEAQRIMDAQKQQQILVAVQEKGNLDINAIQKIDCLLNNCAQRINNMLQGINRERLADRINAIDQTRKYNGNCFNYASQVSHLKLDACDEKVFQNTYGTHLDCQLHKELCQTRSTMRHLESTYSRDLRVQILAPVVYRYTAQAKNEKCPLVAFELADFCHTITQVLSQGMDVLYNASSAIGKGAWKGINDFASIERWQDMATGVLQLGLIFVNELGQEDALRYAMVLSATSHNSDVFSKACEHYSAHAQVQHDAINYCAQETYKKIKAMSWQEILEHGTEIGTTMILDTLALNAVSGFGRTAGNLAIKQLNNTLESGVLLTEQYAVEVAGFGKLIVEEGAEVSVKAADIIKNESMLFAKSTEGVAQQIKNKVAQVKWSEDIVQKIRNVGDDILDVMEKAGGHTLKEHVSKTHSELALRVSKIKIGTITTFTNKRTAINAVKENLKHNAEEIVSWLMTNPPYNTKKSFDSLHSYHIGEGIIKGKKNGLHHLNQSRIVLTPCSTNEFGFEIITSFPINKH